MKVFIVVMLLVSFLQSDEIQRIESIVQDIAKLRADYKKCQESLNDKEAMNIDFTEYPKNEYEMKDYERLLKDEKEKNEILKAEIYSTSILLSNSKNMIKQYEELLESQNNEIESLNSKLDNSDIYISVCKDNQEEKDSFPKLMPKEQKEVKEKKKVEKAADEIVKEVQKEIVQEIEQNNIKESIEVDKIQIFSARPFRLTKDSSIYDSINGRKIDEWEVGTSFTSNQKTKKWIKITGHFVNKKWRRSQKEMWIKSSNVVKR